MIGEPRPASDAAERTRSAPRRPASGPLVIRAEHCHEDAPPSAPCAPAIVLDPVTARDTIARAAYESAKSEHPSVRTWHELDETVRDHWRRIADAVLAALASQERGE